MTEILKAEDVHKNYRIGKRSVEVLHGVSLSVLRGERRFGVEVTSRTWRTLGRILRRMS